MRAFILHTPDCSEIKERIEVSHVTMRSPPPSGYMWTEVSPPVSHWTVQLDGNGQPEVVEYARPGPLRLALTKSAKWAEIKRVREERFIVTPTDFGSFDTDATGRDNIQGQIDAFNEMAALGLPLPETVSWKLHDNTFVSLTPTQLREVGLAAAQYRGEVYSTSWTLEALIAQADTVEEVEAISWPSS